MKKWLGRIAMILGGICIALAGMEILSYVFWEQISELPNKNPISFVTRSDYKRVRLPQFVWAGQPGAIKEFHNISSRNQLGFHDHEYTFAKSEGAFRIIVLGDSFVEAKEVPIAKSFHKILEKKLNDSFSFPIEVISLGRSGNGTIKNMKILLDYGFCFQPDLVIMQFLSNDLIDDNPKWFADQRQQNRIRNKYIPELNDLYPRYLVIKKSRFNQLLALKIARFVQGIQTRKFAKHDKYKFVHVNTLIFTQEFSRQWKEAWENTKNHIRLSRDIANKKGSEFLLVSFPELWRIGDKKKLRRWVKTMSPEAQKYNWDFDKTDRILQSFCQKNNILFLSLLPEFGSEFSKTKKFQYFSYDMHLNERGHRLAASILFDFISKKILLQRH